MKAFRVLMRLLAVLLFSLSALGGAALFITANWADVESILYGFPRYGNKSTFAMHCPLVITTAETGQVTFTFENDSDVLLRPTVRFQVSNPGPFRLISERLELQPGESRQLQVEVYPNDAVLNRYIFVKMYTFATYPVRQVEQTCGILLLDLPGLTGGQVVAVGVAVALLGMPLGLGLWMLFNRPLAGRSLDAARAMGVLTVSIWLGLLAVFLAWWLLGLVLTAVTILLIGAILANLLQTH
ncbi:MAG: hypothetical protein ABWK53_10590 [Anaerolineales bacterium]